MIVSLIVKWFGGIAWRTITGRSFGSAAASWRTWLPYAAIIAGIGVLLMVAQPFVRKPHIPKNLMSLMECSGLISQSRAETLQSQADKDRDANRSSAEQRLELAAALAQERGRADGLNVLLDKSEMSRNICAPADAVKRFNERVTR